MSAAIAAATANSSDEYVYPNRLLFNDAAIRSETTEVSLAIGNLNPRDGAAAANSTASASFESSGAQNICTAAELVKISSSGERRARHFVVTDQTLYYFEPFSYDSGALAFIPLDAITGITVSSFGSPTMPAPVSRVSVSSPSSDAAKPSNNGAQFQLSSAADYAAPIVADFLLYADIAIHSAAKTGAANETASTTMRQCVFHLCAAGTCLDCNHTTAIKIAPKVEPRLTSKSSIKNCKYTISLCMFTLPHIPFRVGMSAIFILT